MTQQPCVPQAWICINASFPQPECPSPPDLACYVYNHVLSEFVYYGPNSYLGLV